MSTFTLFKYFFIFFIISAEYIPVGEPIATASPIFLCQTPQPHKDCRRINENRKGRQGQQIHAECGRAQALGMIIQFVEPIVAPTATVALMQKEPICQGQRRAICSFKSPGPAEICLLLILPISIFLSKADVDG